MGPNARPAVMLRGRHRIALRAVRENPRGLRLQAYPTALADLAAMGLVEAGEARWRGARAGDRAWFLTDLGRRVDRAHGDLPDE